MGQKTINILKQKEGLDLSKAGPELFRHQTHTDTQTVTLAKNALSLKDLVLCLWLVLLYLG